MNESLEFAIRAIREDAEKPLRAEIDRLRGLLRELHECGAVTNWMRVSDDLRGRVLAAIGAADQPPAARAINDDQAQMDACRLCGATDPYECGCAPADPVSSQPAAVQEIFGGDGSRELWRLINAVDHEKPEWEALYAIGCACQRLEALVRRLADNSPAATTPATEAQPPAALGDELIAWECRNCGELHRQNEDGCSCGWSRERGRATFKSGAAP